MRVPIHALVTLGLVNLAAGMPAYGGLYKTQKQALEEVFPGGEVERKTFFLTDGQASKVERCSRSQLPSKIVHV